MSTQLCGPSADDTSPMAGNFVHRVCTGALLLILAFTFPACGDAEVDDVSDFRTEGEMADRDAMAGDHMVAVSIVNGGDIVPTMPAGHTTLTVDNMGNEDCVFTMQPISGGDITNGSATRQGRGYGQGADGSVDENLEGRSGATSGQDAERLGSKSDDESVPSNPEAGLSSDDRAGIPGGEAGPGTLHGGSTNRITAGQEGKVTMNLEPGMYQATCNGSSGTAAQNQTDPLIVMVTDEEVSTGNVRSRRGTMDDNAGTESSAGPATGARR